MSGFRPRFFLDSSARLSSSADSLPVDTELELSATDSHHALRVLRLKQGDACEVVIEAAAYAAVVGSTKDPVKVVLGERLRGAEAGAVYNSQVGLVQALIRPALLDQVLEKGTEVGTSFFVLVPAAASKRLPDSALASRLERWRRIVVEAAKQSKQSVVPTVDFAPSLKAALDRLNAENAVSLVLEPSAASALGGALERQLGAPDRAPLRLALWTGPESGWSREESRWFTEAGVEAARLGQAVLRAETAGPVAVSATRLMTGDW